MKDTLIGTLKGAGKSVELCRIQDRSEVLILPHGGRILGLFAAGSSQNFLWTHPALATASTALAFFDSDQWHNSGGDRTWLAPEVDFFFPEFPSTDRYWQPSSLIRATTRSAGRRRTRVDQPTDGQALEIEGRGRLRITKVSSPAADPLRHEHGTSRQGSSTRAIRSGPPWNGSARFRELGRGAVEPPATASRRRDADPHPRPDPAPGLLRDGRSGRPDRRRSPGAVPDAGHGGTEDRHPRDGGRPDGSPIAIGPETVAGPW